MRDTSRLVPLVRARRHSWGVGKTHLIESETDRTFCGQTPAKCPGDKFWGAEEHITCGGCKAKLARVVEREERTRRAAERSAQYEARRIEEERDHLAAARALAEQHALEAERRRIYQIQSSQRVFFGEVEPPTYVSASRQKWREAYEEYLDSPHWEDTRRRVLQRADWKCEACGARAADQVHHMRYPRNCFPGSEEWKRQQKLFDLRAICRTCHIDVHPQHR